MPINIDRFWSKVDKTDDCWLWIACIAPNGYGRFKSTEGQLAHRIAYEQIIGKIPKGLHLDHLCRNRHCVNPDHLEAVTNYENISRGDTLVSRNLSKTACPKGHPYTANNTRIIINEYGHTSRICRSCDRARKRAVRGL